MTDYTLEEPTKEVADNLTTELQAILAKYDCEITVSSEIHILQRKPITQDDTPNEQEETTEVLEADGSDQA